MKAITPQLLFATRSQGEALCQRDRIRMPNAPPGLLVPVVTVMLAASWVWGAPLTTLRYEIVGTQLKVSPAMVSVPKGVPGSVLVQIAFGDGTTNATTAQMGEGAYVEATLRGPSFDARRLVGQPNAALLLPPLNLVGDYQLDNIRLVDSSTGAVRMEGSPSSVPVH